jgi:hypothetical protein
MSTDEIERALSRAKQVLETAYFGLRVLRSSNMSERSAGLRNVLVFGRSVTFVIQNLSSIVGSEIFAQWYSPHQETMKRDPLMKYFVEARNNLEKQGRLDVGIAAEFNCSSEDIRKGLGPPPPGAVSAFIGDSTGGSGWEIDVGNGETIKYYVNFPQSFANVKQVFHSMPDTIPDHLQEMAVDELCEMVLGKLTAVLDDAYKVFLSKPKTKVPYLRLVK